MGTNSDKREIEKFDTISPGWWDPRGKMGTLQIINPLRTRFVLEQLDLERPRILDVGCGGGILSESLARSGAGVTGLDLSEASLNVARQHAQSEGLVIDYRCISIGDMAEEYQGSFDAVTCMEMLEHVPDPIDIVRSCAGVLKPGGHAFFSTIDRTLKSFLFAIIGGEYILHLLSRGSHTWSKFIRPAELKRWAADAGLEFRGISSLKYNPFLRRFKIIAGREDIFYLVHFIRKQCVEKKFIKKAVHQEVDWS
jgi:2-polyprenyl-6-hydroxyphenyl methylase / 3-demethylubiquinone-9 3-methyltransferase